MRLDSKSCVSSSSLLSSLLILVSSFISSSIPSRGHSWNVLDENDDMNALTGVVANELMDVADYDDVVTMSMYRSLLI